MKIPENVETVCYHHIDHDGQCSAAAVKLLVDADAFFIPVNHNLPFPTDTLRPDMKVWIVDYSPVPAIMDEIISVVGVENIVWIDHHRTAFEQYEGYLHEIKGLRYNSLAACELTWRYVFDTYCEDTHKEIPQFVTLIGAYDTWRWSKMPKREAEWVLDFGAGLASFDTNPDSHVWYELFYFWDKTQNVARDGKVVRRYRDNNNKRHITDWAFVAKIDGVDCLVCDARGGSDVFGDLQKLFPVTSIFIHDGEKFSVSIYSWPNENQVDVGRIAEKMGKKYGNNGGGHKGAAGFQAPELPYTDIKRIDWDSLDIGKDG